MEYFFDASAGVNFGGDFDFAPQVNATSSMMMPDFSAPSHLDHHHHHTTSSSSSSTHVIGSGQPFSFYGSSDSPFSLTGESGSKYYPPPPSNEAISSSSSSSSAAAVAATSSLDAATAALSSFGTPTPTPPLSTDQVSPSSSSSSSSCSNQTESPAAATAAASRFHDVTTAFSGSSILEDSHEGNSSSSFSAAAAAPSPKQGAFDLRSASSSASLSTNSDSGIASSSSSSSCVDRNEQQQQQHRHSHFPASGSTAMDLVVSASSSKSSVTTAAAEEDDEDEDSSRSEEPTIDININNVVCSFSVRCHLNLRKVALEACNTEYNRERACVSMKLRKPKITASIWNSGKITCIGATSEDDAKKGARRIARLLLRMGFNVHFCRFRVVNVLASCTMPFAIRLHKFSAKYPKQVEYEPELHPGATYKIKHPKATLKIFSTGSITITAPQISHIAPAVEHIYPRVQEFRMDEKDKESGEMANLVPKAFVPLNTKHGRIKHIPKGPFHSKFKQVIHQQDLVKKAIQQVKDNDSSDEDAMYMGCDDDC